MSDEWLILHGGALGDLVLTLQLAMRLARPRDGAAVLVASRTSLRGLDDAAPAVRHVSTEAAGVHWLYVDDDRSPPPVLAELVGGRCVLSTLGPREHPVQQRLARLRPARLRCLDPRPPSENAAAERHITEIWLERLEGGRCEAPPPTSAAEVRPSPAARSRGRRMLAAAGVLSTAEDPAPVVLLHIGSGGARKRWPLDGFLHVAAVLRARGAACGVLIGPDEIEGGLLSGVKGCGLPLIESPDSATLVACLSAADAFLGNDAGPTHLAALLGMPTLALFGPTRAAVWRPLGARVRVVQGDASGGGASWGIEPCEVAGRLFELLGSRRPPPV
ncbi:MAG: hypothetical protein LC135_14220 [Phycisphaerae bacterium]|nr:hypothetical protein [Phycisphaerae bacterium]MCZ2401005.1 hypothetical protein [Phycisphaerae bacterium]